MLLYLILLFCVPCAFLWQKRVLKLALLYVVISLLGSAWLAADAVAQSRAGVLATTGQNPVGGNKADYALMLKDPFSPIGYRLPMSAANASAVSNVPPPSVGLKVKAKSLLQVRGIIKRGNAYVANINGAIVRAGDEIDVMVDGQRVAFIIRTISLKRVGIEPKE